MDIVITLPDDIVPTEYFCKACMQLRLSLNADKTHCLNCGSEDLIVGEVGTLDKQALIKQCESEKD